MRSFDPPFSPFLRRLLRLSTEIRDGAGCSERFGDRPTGKADAIKTRAQVRPAPRAIVDASIGLLDATDREDLTPRLSLDDIRIQ